MNIMPSHTTSDVYYLLYLSNSAKHKFPKSAHKPATSSYLKNPLQLKLESDLLAVLILEINFLITWSTKLLKHIFKWNTIMKAYMQY